MNAIPTPLPPSLRRALLLAGLALAPSLPLPAQPVPWQNLVTLRWSREGGSSRWRSYQALNLQEAPVTPTARAAEDAGYQIPAGSALVITKVLVTVSSFEGGAGFWSLVASPSAGSPGYALLRRTHVLPPPPPGVHGASAHFAYPLGHGVALPPGTRLSTGPADGFANGGIQLDCVECIGYFEPWPRGGGR